MDKIYDSKVMFYMDTLKYLQRGGRIGGVASAVGTALKLKPIISCDREGIYYTVAMIRGAKQGKKKLLDEVLKFIGDCKHCWIIIGHGDALEEAKAMEQMLMEKVRGKRILYIKQITADHGHHGRQHRSRTGGRSGLQGALRFAQMRIAQDEFIMILFR